MRNRFLPTSILTSIFVGSIGCGGTVITEAPTDGGSVDSASVTDSVSIDSATTDGIVVEDAPPATSGAKPPPRPATAATGTTKWFVISHLRLGITDPVTAKPDPLAWRKYGYDLDGRTTTADDSKNSTNSCKRVAGSMTRVLQDGDLGRDNNFGQHFMAIIKSLKADAEEAVNGAIATGDTTVLLRLDNVGADDNASVPGTLYRTLPLGKTPSFTEADHYTVDYALIDSSKESMVKFPKGYMTHGTWVSGELGGDRVVLSFPGFGIGAAAVIDMPHGTMSFDVKTGTNGVIAGVVDSHEFMKGFDGGLRAAGICPGNATYDQVVLTVVESSDLVMGAPPFQNTSTECNSLSIGMGFDVKPTGNFGAISGAPSVPDPCITH